MQALVQSLVQALVQALVRALMRAHPHSAEQIANRRDSAVARRAVWRKEQVCCAHRLAEPPYDAGPTCRCLFGTPVEFVL